ncbi:cyclic nucleotide-binding domain-containing protein [Actinomadura decatromicini]|uniref:Cyclic nucleotide-binding domain-containing protein n=1 Tax=Actinomadura decatromicini TaxID=2604572 RepID=A0A5D3FHY3_9ACTN|nr:cyclic nucleotide-binding domain-containing protein [Actinomadura decatromicini]TYK46915.1 cyclic nucleotide-binding domain-containing protein [Actinomadura decatromicini]
MDEHTRHHDPDQIVPSELDAAADRHSVRPATAAEHQADTTDHQPPAPGGAEKRDQAHVWPGTGSQAVARRAGAPVPAGGAAGVRQVLTPPLQGFWGALTETEQDALLAIAQEVVYPVGTILWAEGQAADQAVVIQAGSVRVSVNRDGHERIIAFRRPGDIIGERAALLMRRRSATIVAMGTVRGLRMTTLPFAAYLSDHPRVVDVLERELYDRLTEQSGQRRTAPPPYGPAAQYGYGGPRNGSGMQYAPGTLHGYETAAGYTVQPGYAGQGGYAGQNSQESSYAAQPEAEHDGAANLYGQQHAYATVPMALPPTHQNGQGAHLVPASSIPYEDEDDDEDKATQPMVLTPSPQAGPSWTGRNCTIAYTDIAGFSQSHRNDRDRLDMRRAMYTLLREAFEEAGVPWGVCHLEDRGDGALIVVPPEVPTAAVVDAVIASLARRLRRHNEKASAPVRFQLRVAVHVGPVMPDPPGVSGWALIRTARLLDARPLKDRLAASGADLGFIASTFVYESVIAHGPGYVNPAEYEPISCRVKKLKTEGWIHLCGVRAQSAV